MTTPAIAVATSVRRSPRRTRLIGAAAAALLVPLTAVPAGASHITVVDISKNACTSEVERGRFDDVDPASTFAPAIDCVAWWGITTGNTPTTYNPAATVTRVQMAMFVQRLSDSLGAEFDTADAGFTDVGHLGPAARDAINALANAGVVTGTSSAPKTYSPGAPVTRAQMAAYLNRLQAALDGQGFAAPADYFDDDNDLRLQGDINALAAAGIVSGTGQDRAYNPGGLVTRAQMAGFMARYIERALSSQFHANLIVPPAIKRGYPGVTLDYVIRNPERIARDRVGLRFVVEHERGLDGTTQFEIGVQDPATGQFQPVLMRPANGALVPDLSRPFDDFYHQYIPLSDAETTTVKVTVSPHPYFLPEGEMAISTQLVTPEGEVLAETFDFFYAE